MESSGGLVMNGTGSTQEVSKGPAPVLADQPDLFCLPPAIGFGNWVSPAFGSATSHKIITAESSAARRPAAISRTDLESAIVVGQAHCKFIVCVCRSTGGDNSRDAAAGPLVLLVDQHAADERVRLEAMEDTLLLSNRGHPPSCEDGTGDGRCDAKQQSVGGISDAAVARIGRNGREVWEAVRTALRPPPAIDGFDPSQRRLLDRFRPAVEAWGFQVFENAHPKQL